MCLHLKCKNPIPKKKKPLSFTFLVCIPTTSNSKPSCSLDLAPTCRIATITLHLSSLGRKGRERERDNDDVSLLQLCNFDFRSSLCLLLCHSLVSPFFFSFTSFFIALVQILMEDLLNSSCSISVSLLLICSDYNPESFFGIQKLR